MTKEDIQRIVSYCTYVLPLIILIILALYLTTSNRSGDIFNNYVWGLSILIPLLLVLMMANNFPALVSKKGFLGMVVAIVAGFALMLYAYQQVTVAHSYSIGQTSHTFALVMMVLIGLAILFSVLYSYTQYRTWTGFWMKLLFYVPCLMIDAIVDISKDLGVTPRPILVLTALEIILIVWYFWGDKIAAWIRKRTGNSGSNGGVHVLLSSPIMLHAKQEIVLANSDALRMTTTTAQQAINQQNPYRKSYTISMWVFINANDYVAGYEHPPEFNLLYYGGKVLDKDNKWIYKDPKPRLTYTYDKVAKADSYQVYIDNESAAPYKFSVENQKWNQIVFVYQDSIGNGRIDMFVNGHLVKSWDKFTPPIFTANDKIVVGDESHKLYGSIQGVTYYESALTPSQVSDAYNYSEVRLQVPFMTF
jgi:Concanavalin A-like lectin/glucanases superfamily